MGIFIYFVLTLFCGYMAFELGRYVIATGDAPALNHSSFIGFIINTLHKANIQGNQEQRPRHPRLIGRSTWNNREEGLGFCAES